MQAELLSLLPGIMPGSTKGQLDVSGHVSRRQMKERIQRYSHGAVDMQSNPNILI